MTEPRSTYRLQLHRDFDFARAAAILPYLEELGISHVYCSPYFQAATGSTHGYDVTDPTTVNRELGGEAGRERLVAALRRAGLGQVLDIVPNHMAASEENGWWWDVLKNGQQSAFAPYFDIDWEPPAPSLRGRVLLPVLGGPLRRVLRSGELRLVDDQGTAELAYHERRFPLSPHHRPAWWRIGSAWVNYRRFFDIAGLVCLNVQREAVFLATHARVIDWLRDGTLDGVRVDHPDGLLDPGGYFERLRAVQPAAWIVAEKILQPGEPLPDWPVDGTTGYDFIQRLTGLFVDPAGEAPLTALFARLTGERRPFSEVAQACKTQVVRDLFQADIRRLDCLLERVLQASQDAPAADARQRRQAIAELVCGFSVYRTYIRPGAPPSPDDRRRVEEAATRAAQRRPELSELISFLRGLLLEKPEATDPLESELVLRLQQLSGPVMAKALEDTAFYRYSRLLALNEVGGDPGSWGLSVDRFHQLNLEAQRRWPGAMLAASTHDTKRSEDVRARLCLLSEIPDRWSRIVSSWMELASAYRDASGWDSNLEYYLYQTLVGAHPLPLDRALEHMRKAAREAKLRTSWLRPDAGYEGALERFVRALYQDRAFLEQLERFVESLRDAGWINSLAARLLSLTAPGVPDVYQGTELWDLSLTDPDNRRPVDFELRRGLLHQLRGLQPEEVWQRRAEGLPKLHVLRVALDLRNRRPQVFGREGDYEPLVVTGEKSGHAVAFMRQGCVVTVVPRLTIRRDGGWQDTAVRIPKGSWRNLLTGDRHAGGTIAMDQVTARFPVALLERD